MLILICATCSSHVEIYVQSSIALSVQPVMTCLFIFPVLGSLLLVKKRPLYLYLLKN